MLFRSLGAMTILWASPVGLLRTTWAGTLDYNNMSALVSSYSARLEWRLSLPGRRFLPRLGASLEYRDSGFRTPGAVDKEIAPESLSFSAQLGQLLPGGSGSFGTYGTATLVSGALHSYSLAAGIFMALSTETSLSVSTGFTGQYSVELKPSVSVALSVAPEDGRTLFIRQDLVKRTGAFDLALPLYRPDSLALRLSGEGFAAASDNMRRLSLGGRLDGEHVGLSTAVGYSIVPDTGPGLLNFSFTAVSSFAYAGGLFGAASRPGDSFLFLLPHSSLGSDTLVMRPSAGPVSTSIDGRPRLVTGLRPNTEIFADISLPESPVDRRPEPSTIRILPAHRSGTIVEVRVTSTLAIRGRLVDARGLVIPFRGGVIFDSAKAGEPVGSTFSDADGVFEYYGLKAGNFHILWSDGERSTLPRISLPAEKPPYGQLEPVIELGDIVAEPLPERTQQ